MFLSCHKSKDTEELDSNSHPGRGGSCCGESVPQPRVELSTRGRCVVSISTASSSCYDCLSIERPGQDNLIFIKIPKWRAIKWKKNSLSINTWNPQKTFISLIFQRQVT